MMNNIQEITIDNLAETLEYNGWSIVRGNSGWKYDYINSNINIYWDDSVPTLRINVDNETICMLPKCHFDIILLTFSKYVELKPLPKKPNLWDWFAQNKKATLLLIDKTEMFEGRRELFFEIITQHKETLRYTLVDRGNYYEFTYEYFLHDSEINDDSDKACSVDIHKDLFLNIQINLLNDFMEAYNE